METPWEDSGVKSVAADRGWATNGIWTGIRRTLQKPEDVGLALRIGLFLIVMPWRLERSPLDAVLCRIERSRKSRSGDLEGGIGRISRLRQAWLASPLLRERNTCYLRAITLYRFLDPHGRGMRIHFGVEPGVNSNDRLRGHAWVTLDGVLLEAPEPVLAGRVSEIYAYPPSG